MTEATHHRRFTDETKKYVASNITSLQQGSGILAIVLLGICALTVAATASRLDPAEALYQAGLTAGAVGFIMVIGWGATRIDGSMCTSTATVADGATQEVEERIDALEAALSARLDEADSRLKGISDELRSVIEAQRETIAALREAVGSQRDELTPRRSHR